MSESRDTEGSTQLLRREDAELDRQEDTDRSQLPSGMLEPIADPDEIVKGRAKRSELIAEALEEGRDYGSVPGIPKPFLQKPGAERLTDAFGCYPRFTVLDTEVDHDRRVEWEKTRRKDGKSYTISGTSKGLYRYVVSCELVHRASGIVVGNGLGSCSTMESKYVDRPRDSENTCLKMAKKRAHVDAALSTFGLSEMFTQDEDYVRSDAGPDHSTPVLERHPPHGKHTDKTWATVAEEHPGYVKWAAENTDWLTDEDLAALRRHVAGEGEETSEAESGAEPSSAPPSTETPAGQWLALYESHRGTDTQERFRWERQVLEDAFGDEAPMKDGRPDHAAMGEKHYTALADALRAELDAAAQTEMV